MKLKPIVLSLFALVMATAAVRADVNIVFIGNSISEGATLPNPATQSPPVLVGQMLGGMIAPAVKVRNCAVSGYTTFHFLPGQGQYNKVVKAAEELSAVGGPLCFSIMLGTNDSAEKGPLGAPVSPSVYKENMRRIIDSLHCKFPRAKFILNYPIWYSPNTHNGATYLAGGLARLRSYHPVISEIVAEYAKSDKGMVFAGSKKAFGFFKNNRKYFTVEKGNSGTFYLHPNARGAEKLARYWANSIMRALASGGVRKIAKAGKGG